MRKKLPKLWGSGHLPINGVFIDAYILEDGTPLIGKTKVLAVLGRPKKGDGQPDRPEFLSARNLQKYITPELEDRLKGVEFKAGEKTVLAYHADILPMICNVYLEARRASDLTKNQEPIAMGCEILLTIFAKVGIIALIYEQLGFEKNKHPEALRMLVESYMAEEVRKWAKEFPDELFRQMDKIYNSPTTARNRPQHYAKFIRKYIYDPLERGMVLSELDKVNPVTEKGYRKKKHHSHLSENIGLNSLRAQIWQVIATLKISPNKRKFEANYARIIGPEYQTDMFEDYEPQK